MTPQTAAAEAERTRLEPYQTTDIYFSAYLVALGLPLQGTEWESENGKRKLVFIFRLTKRDVKRLKASFFGNTGTVKVMTFVNALKGLKQMCYV